MPTLSPGRIAGCSLHQTSKPIASPAWRKEDLSHWMTSRPTAVFNWFAAFK